MCVECGTGKYSTAVLATSSGTCQSCLAGKYLDVQGATSESDCRDCRVGTYQNSIGQANCTACPVNTYGTLLAASAEMYCLSCPSSTLACPSGYLFVRPTVWPYNDDVEKSQSCTPYPAGQECTSPPCFERCTLCKPGTYKGCAGTVRCSQCEVGTYQAGYGSTGCQVCPSGTKDEVGQTTNESCTCDTGHYKIEASSTVCQVCPAGLTCFGNATIIPKPVPLSISGSEDSVWKPDICGLEQIYFLVTCPTGYFIAQPPCDPFKDSKKDCQTPCNQNVQQQCIQCPIGQDCTSPPCVGKCVKCYPGFWKASRYPSSDSPGFYMNAFINPWL